MKLKFLKLFEDYSSFGEEVEEYIINNYYDNDYKIEKAKEPLSPSINNSEIEFKNKIIRFNEIPNLNYVIYSIHDKTVEDNKDDNEEDILPYNKFQPLNPWEKTYDFHKDERFKHLFYGENFSEKEFKEFSKFLNTHKEDYVLMYHGTSCDIPIEEEGIKKTTGKTKRSLQSQPDFVYLSVFPGMGEKFAKMAYPNREICVYQVFIKIKYLRPDKDQLFNKEVYSGITLNPTLANSLVYGHGARVPRNIEPYELTKYNI
jgi:hypothetical protein